MKRQELLSQPQIIKVIKGSENPNVNFIAP